MDKYRKPFFWGLVLLLFVGLCCAGSLGGYIVFGQPFISKLNQAGKTNPGLSNSDDPLTIQATLSALKFDQNQYYQQGDVDNAMSVTEKIIALSPNDPKEYFDAAFIARNLAAHRTNLNDYRNLLLRALSYADKGISLDPKYGENYVQRAWVYDQLSSIYSYRVDRDYLERLTLDNFKAGASLGTISPPHPERRIVVAENKLHDCDNALNDALKIEAAESPDDVTTFTISSLLEQAYACKGDYQKALDYHMADLKQTNTNDLDCGCASDTAIYLYQLGRSDEALDLLNQAIQKKPNYGGDRYFIRAVIEFDRGDYAKALDDAQQAEGNSWAFGMLTNYIEGLNFARLGNKEQAIVSLKEAEAALPWRYFFAIQRAQKELEKLGVTPLSPTPSVEFAVTPMPVFPTVDLSKLPTRTPTPVTK